MCSFKVLDGKNASMSHCPLMHVQTMAATLPRHFCHTAWTWLEACGSGNLYFCFRAAFYIVEGLAN